MKQCVDLHIHSTKSDGTLTPREIVELALNLNLDTISITDHDTIDGIAELLSSKKPIICQGLNLLTGVEISVKYHPGALHMLGYGVDISNSDFLKKLTYFQNIRLYRNNKILEKLRDEGIDINHDELKTISSKGQSQGRPHIARLMVHKGVVKSIDDAFQLYLGQGKKAYVEKEMMTPKEAIQLIHNAGGLAFIAHPKTLSLDGDALSNFLNRLIEYGLNGLEVYASMHSSSEISLYREIAIAKGLLISGGSDFHGSVKPDINLGQCSDNRIIQKKDLSLQLFEKTVSI